MSNFIAGGCSFTFGNELSDDVAGNTASEKSWAYLLHRHTECNQYVCVAKGGIGNSAIARRVFQAIDENTQMVAVMWTFPSRYDWAMPRHKSLEGTRWASMSPWDTKDGSLEAYRLLQGSEPAKQDWQERQEHMVNAGVRPLAEAIYKYGANQYHEAYLSWKSIIWLQNILEKKNIPFFFTLADNTLFYNEMEPLCDLDNLMRSLYQEIDFTKWFFFGERQMGFNQWAWLNDYERATTHPLDKAHEDAIMLMQPEFNKIIGGQR